MRCTFSMHKECFMLKVCQTCVMDDAYVEFVKEVA